MLSAWDFRTVDVPPELGEGKQKSPEGCTSVLAFQFHCLSEPLLAARTFSQHLHGSVHSLYSNFSVFFNTEDYISPKVLRIIFKVLI